MQKSCSGSNLLLQNILLHTEGFVAAFMLLLKFATHMQRFPTSSMLSKKEKAGAIAPA